MSLTNTVPSKFLIEAPNDSSHTQIPEEPEGGPFSNRVCLFVASHAAINVPLNAKRCNFRTMRECLMKQLLPGLCRWENTGTSCSSCRVCANTEQCVFWGGPSGSKGVVVPLGCLQQRRLCGLRHPSKTTKPGQSGLSLERETGLEPATSSLGSLHSTTELLAHSVS